MSDLNPLLDNRNDLEKLEQDLAALSGVAASALGAGIQQRVQKARRDLETARTAHIELCYQLNHPDAGQRATARQQLQQRIKAGELKIYDPQAAAWRSAAELLMESNQREDDAKRREIEFRQLEAALQSAAETPRGLKNLSELIEKAEELERQTILSSTGQDALQKARRSYEAGQKEHRKLTMLMRSGNLEDRVWVIKSLKRLIADGESEILEAPAQKWRPAEQVLDDAIREYQAESARSVDQVLRKAGELYKTHPDMVLSTLYLALNKNIPYTEADRQRLEEVYLERHAENPKAATSTHQAENQMGQEDLEGFKTIHEVTRQRLKILFNRSSEWLNQFFRSSITRNLQKLLEQADAKETPLGKTVEIINMTETLARKQMEGSLEIPEVMVRGAKILFNKNEARMAREMLEKALPLYTLERPDKIHRHAVTSWLLGCLDYYLGDRLDGYTEWKEARGLFDELRLEARRTRHNEKTRWYQARLNDMDTSSIQTFEVVYFGWMNQFDEHARPLWLMEYRQMMDTQFGLKKIVELRKTIALMLRDAERARRPEDLWQSWIEAAFFEYQTTDYMGAINHLEQAAIGFQYDHRCAVTLWLLGMMRWWLPSQRADAILNWEESIRRFEDMAQTADRSNRQSQRLWYETQIGMMKTSLRQWINLTQV